MKKKKAGKVTKPMAPRTELAKRFAAIMHRGASKEWPPHWINAFIKLVPYLEKNLDGLAKVERRYRTQWPPNSGKNSLRHNLYTLINKYYEEEGTSVAWCDANPERKERPKVIPMELPSTRTELSEEERHDSQLFMEKFSTFKKVRKAMNK